MVNALVAVIILLAAVWVAGVLYMQDFGVPRYKLGKFKRAMIIFPHADDETNVAGLAWLLGKRGAPVTFVVLTKGEKGTPDAHRDDQLRSERTDEMQQAVTELCGGSLIQEDFGDGQLATKIPALKAYLEKLLAAEQPDLVITYDQAGMYGHDDHLACTKALTEVLRNSQAKTQLWYLAFTPHLWRHLHLPVHMAKDRTFNDQRAKPTMRLFVGRGVLAKINAVYRHKSQRQSFQKMMPWHLPIWLVYSLLWFEYYERMQ